MQSHTTDLLGHLDPEDAETKSASEDRAYVGSGPRMFRGLVLQSWSGRRRAATFEIGFSASGSVLDPIRVLYTCAIPANEVDMVFRNNIIATEAFLVWAEKNECLDPSLKSWQDAFDVAQEILKEVEDSLAAPANDSPGKALMGNGTGHQNSPPTSAT